MTVSIFPKSALGVFASVANIRAKLNYQPSSEQFESIEQSQLNGWKDGTMR